MSTIEHWIQVPKITLNLDEEPSLVALASDTIKSLQKNQRTFGMDNNKSQSGWLHDITVTQARTMGQKRSPS